MATDAVVVQRLVETVLGVPVVLRVVEYDDVEVPPNDHPSVSDWVVVSVLLPTVPMDDAIPVETLRAVLV